MSRVYFQNVDEVIKAWPVPIEYERGVVTDGLTLFMPDVIDDVFRINVDVFNAFVEVLKTANANGYDLIKTVFVYGSFIYPFMISILECVGNDTEIESEKFIATLLKNSLITPESYKDFFAENISWDRHLDVILAFVPRCIQMLQRASTIEFAQDFVVEFGSDGGAKHFEIFPSQRQRICGVSTFKIDVTLNSSLTKDDETIKKMEQVDKWFYEFDDNSVRFVMLMKYFVKATLSTYSISVSSKTVENVIVDKIIAAYMILKVFDSNSQSRDFVTILFEVSKTFTLYTNLDNNLEKDIMYNKESDPNYVAFMKTHKTQIKRICILAKLHLQDPNVDSNLNQGVEVFGGANIQLILEQLDKSIEYFVSKECSVGQNGQLIVNSFKFDNNPNFTISHVKNLVNGVSDNVKTWKDLILRHYGTSNSSANPMYSDFIQAIAIVNARVLTDDAYQNYSLHTFEATGERWNKCKLTSDDDKKMWVFTFTDQSDDSMDTPVGELNLSLNHPFTYKFMTSNGSKRDGEVDRYVANRLLIGESLNVVPQLLALLSPPIISPTQSSSLVTLNSVRKNPEYDKFVNEYEGRQKSLILVEPVSHIVTVDTIVQSLTNRAIDKSSQIAPLVTSLGIFEMREQENPKNLIITDEQLFMIQKIIATGGNPMMTLFYNKIRALIQPLKGPKDIYVVETLGKNSPSLIVIISIAAAAWFYVYKPSLMLNFKQETTKDYSKDPAFMENVINLSESNNYYICNSSVCVTSLPQSMFSVRFRFRDVLHTASMGITPTGFGLVSEMEPLDLIVEDSDEFYVNYQVLMGNIGMLPWGINVKLYDVLIQKVRLLTIENDSLPMVSSIIRYVFKSETTNDMLVASNLIRQYISYARTNLNKISSDVFSTWVGRHETISLETYNDNIIELIRRITVIYTNSIMAPLRLKRLENEAMKSSNMMITNGKTQLTLQKLLGDQQSQGLRLKEAFDVIKSIKDGNNDNIVTTSPDEELKRRPRRERRTQTEQQQQPTTISKEAFQKMFLDELNSTQVKTTIKDEIVTPSVKELGNYVKTMVDTKVGDVNTVLNDEFKKLKSFNTFANDEILKLKDSLGKISKDTSDLNQDILEKAKKSLARFEIMVDNSEGGVEEVRGHVEDLAKKLQALNQSTPAGSHSFAYIELHRLVTQINEKLIKITPLVVENETIKPSSEYQLIPRAGHYHMLYELDFHVYVRMIEFTYSTKEDKMSKAKKIKYGDPDERLTKKKIISDFKRICNVYDEYQQGYIFKYMNFWWIDYFLSFGASSAGCTNFESKLTDYKVTGVIANMDTPKGFVKASIPLNMIGFDLE